MKTFYFTLLFIGICFGAISNFTFVPIADGTAYPQGISYPGCIGCNFYTNVTYMLVNQAPFIGALQQKGYIKFDISSLSPCINITNATLRFVLQSNTSNTISINLVTGNWSNSLICPQLTILQLPYNCTGNVTNVFEYGSYSSCKSSGGILNSCSSSVLNQVKIAKTSGQVAFSLAPYFAGIVSKIYTVENGSNFPTLAVTCTI